MEDEVNYSTVVFKKNQPPKENKEEETVYSEVKRKEPATVVSKDKAATRSHSRLLLVCLGMLCVLLILGIAIIIYISVMMNEQQAHLRKVTADSERLIVEKRILENRTEELSKDRDYHNRMLEVILKFDNFPVKDFCPDKKCQPCRKGWVQHQNKCYLFYNEDMPWKTWKDSRKSCKDIQSDLVVIDTFQEQVSSNITI
ncbi:C-type lectin domain family 12 member B-like [Leuresthes tenuis]|uniref:C-type lectin domain family 12 member B-like n=1 Tax=Leuresthes tenuis TaxID=355514 RepID=UPI003B5150FD